MLNGSNGVISFRIPGKIVAKQSMRPWVWSELEMMIALYKRGGIDDCIKYLPYRPADQVKKKVHSLLLDISHHSPLPIRESKLAALAKKEACQRARKSEIRPHLSPWQWAKIGGAYKAAKTLGMHVDHIIPLASCRVCGARGDWHPKNLQLLPGTENLSKGNRCMECWESEAA